MTNVEIAGSYSLDRSETIKGFTRNMTDSVSEVMNLMFDTSMNFRPLFSITDSDFQRENTVLGLRQSVYGKVFGSISLMIQTDLLIPLTENFMGKDEEDLRPDDLEITAKHALAMITGNVVKKMDECSSCHLGEIELMGDFKDTPQASSLIIETDHRRMAVGFTLETGQN